MKSNKNVHLFVTCVADRLGAHAGESTVNLLRQFGCIVKFTDQQSCCGQPAYNAGHHDAAASVAKYWLNLYDALVSSDNDYIVVPSGSCGAMIHHYSSLFPVDSPEYIKAQRLSPHVRELTQFLVDDLGVTATGIDLKGKRVAYHDSCHAMRNMNVYAQPRLLLENAGAELVAWDESCCGFGGLFSVKLPQISTAMLDRKLSSIKSQSNVDYLTSTDLGCLLQLSGGLTRQNVTTPVLHIAELLDSSHKVHAL